jgi:hypothetical protein
MSKKKRGEKKSDLEEHEIAGVFCSAVLLGDTSSDSTFLSKASPTRGGRPSEVCCGRKRVVEFLTGCLIWHHLELDGMPLSVHSVEDAEALVCAHRVLGAGDMGSALIKCTAALSITSAAGSTLSLHHPVSADVAVRL